MSERFWIEFSDIGRFREKKRDDTSRSWFRMNNSQNLADEPTTKVACTARTIGLLADVVAGPAFSEVFPEVLLCGCIPQHGFATNALPFGISGGFKPLLSRQRGWAQ